MPTNPSYPGVNIDELLRGTHTIHSGPTSVAAFIGRAKSGPVEAATPIHGMADFDRLFGGLWLGSTLGFAARDFFLNGGNQAVIVRLDNGSGTARIELPSPGGLVLAAASPGSWANRLTASIDHDVPEDGDAFPPEFREAGLVSADLFNLTVQDVGNGAKEEFRNLSVKVGERDVSKVLERESGLVRVETRPDLRPEANAGTSSAVSSDVGDGEALTDAQFLPANGKADHKGLHTLEQLPAGGGRFNLLCIPPYAEGGIGDAVASAATRYCEMRRAMFIMDPPASWKTAAEALGGIGALEKNANAAVFFPRLKQPNPLRDGQVEDFAPCGAVAGIIARTDADYGVWKAPAGQDGDLRGVPELSVELSDGENGELNSEGINCLRSFPQNGPVIWGARTLRGGDALGDEFQYIPVRRITLFIEESLSQGTQWAVFERNDEALWAQLRREVGTFMHSLYTQGAFPGGSPEDAYFVKCDAETTTQSDVDRGVVNIQVGFAPLRPAEFIVLAIQQFAEGTPA